VGSTIVWLNSNGIATIINKSLELNTIRGLLSLQRMRQLARHEQNEMIIGDNKEWETIKNSVF
jgi:hypothetical protein